MNRPTFVFVHGAWHNAAAWQRVIPLLQVRGFAARALDLPGAGAQHIDPVAALIHEVGSPVVLVGHSLGGLTISALAEAMPDQLQAVVYLTALLLPPGMSVAAMLKHETMARSSVPAVLLADPATVGVFRLDPRSEDAAYRAQLRTTFYGDLSETDFDLALAQLRGDEPAAVAQVPSAITPGRFGRVSRHYIRCLEDRAIPLAAQDFMIAAADGALGGRTCVHSLTSSHSPFYSQPKTLADLLAGIAVESGT